MNIKNIRQIVLDTETTGMNTEYPIYKGHNIIEIGAVEIINRKITNNDFHVYLKPNRQVSLEAFKVHGISDEFLYDKPSFKDIYKDFMNYITDSELIIHNSIFDIGFINYEIKKINKEIKINKICKIIDTLLIARKLYPNKRNNLDALCQRFNIDNSTRNFHSALLDAKFLSQIYLLMTSTQKKLFLFSNNKKIEKSTDSMYYANDKNKNFLVLKANEKEKEEHEKILDLIFKINKKCIWRNK